MLQCGHLPDYGTKNVYYEHIKGSPDPLINNVQFIPEDLEHYYFSYWVSDYNKVFFFFWFVFTIFRLGMRALHFRPRTWDFAASGTRWNRTCSNYTLAT